MDTENKVVGLRPPDMQPPRERTEAAVEKTSNAQIIALGPRGRQSCHGCGIQFVPRAAWHRVCPTCYRWSVAGRHIDLAVAAIRGPR